MDGKLIFFCCSINFPPNSDLYGAERYSFVEQPDHINIVPTTTPNIHTNSFLLEVSKKSGIPLYIGFCCQF